MYTAGLRSRQELKNCDKFEAVVVGCNVRRLLAMARTVRQEQGAWDPHLMWQRLLRLATGQKNPYGRCDITNFILLRADIHVGVKPVPPHCSGPSTRGRNCVKRRSNQTAPPYSSRIRHVDEKNPSAILMRILQTCR